MQFLKLNTIQNESLKMITESNTESNNILIAKPNDDYFILEKEILYESVFAFYKPFLLTLEIIELDV